MKGVRKIKTPGEWFLILQRRELRMLSFGCELINDLVNILFLYKTPGHKRWAIKDRKLHKNEVNYDFSTALYAWMPVFQHFPQREEPYLVENDAWEGIVDKNEREKPIFHLSARWKKELCERELWIFGCFQLKIIRVCSSLYNGAQQKRKREGFLEIKHQQKRTPERPRNCY